LLVVFSVRKVYLKKAGVLGIYPSTTTIYFDHLAQFRRAWKA